MSVVESSWANGRKKINPKKLKPQGMEVKNKNGIKRLNCLYVNAQSMNPSIRNIKFEELKIYVANNDLELIGITETWFHSEITSAEVTIPGYKLYRKDRRGKTGGGVALYVSEKLCSTYCNNLSDYVCEACFCNIKIGDRGEEISVGIIYRSQNCSQLENDNMFDLIKLVSNKNVVIMGDFNYPGIDWDMLSSDYKGRDFLKLIQDCFLFQHVNKPTRGDNILDLILSSEENIVEGVQIWEHLGKSDHSMVNWKLVVDLPHYVNNKVLRNFNMANYKLINEYLSKINWDSVLNGFNVEEQWKIFCNIVNKLVGMYVPINRAKPSKPFPKWFNKGAYKAQRHKKAVWHKYQKRKTYNNLVEYKRVSNLAAEVYRDAKKQFEVSLTKNIKTNPKSFYSYVSSKKICRDSVGPLLDADGNIISNDNRICEILNHYFTTVFTDESSLGNLPIIDYGKNSNFLDNIEINESVVSTILQKLKPNRSPGIDEIPTKFLIETAGTICMPLSIIFHNSFSSGAVPTDWKSCNITPIFKSGSKLEPGNYRPISLTSHVCKCLETIIKETMTNFFDDNGIINDTQHGFRKRRSCMSNLLIFFNDVLKWVDEGSSVDVIYLDFKKAFDKVPHERLLLKLRAYGIGGALLNWVGNWLRGRRQRVVLNGNASAWEPVQSGVPQGSVLGPLLFLVFVNDLDEELVNRLLKFADDAKLYGKVNMESEINSIKGDLKKLCDWAATWGMEFNVNKCLTMHFGYKNPNTNYQIDDSILQTTKEEKDLGVIITDNLKVANQCAKAVKTANKILGLVKRTLAIRDKDSILTLYKALVRPHLEYCMSVWRPHLVKDIELLEGVQRRATKIITGFYDLPYEDRLRQLNLTTLETRRIRGDLIEVFKIYHGFTDLNCQDFFTPSSTQLRGHEFKMYKNRIYTDLGKFSFGYRVIDLWNRLPLHAVSCSSVNSFKNKLDIILRHDLGLT